MNDELVKSQKCPRIVIPVKTGIQRFQRVTKTLDTGFHRCDDFLREHQCAECGEAIVDSAALREFGKKLKDFQREIDGLLTGQQIKAIRA